MHVRMYVKQFVMTIFIQIALLLYNAFCSAWIMYVAACIVVHIGE